MELRRWTKLREETIHRNPWWLYMRDRVRHPAGTLGVNPHVRPRHYVAFAPSIVGHVSRLTLNANLSRNGTGRPISHASPNSRRYDDSGR